LYKNPRKWKNKKQQRRMIRVKREVLINDVPIEAFNYRKEDSHRYKINFDFIVKHEDYHDITTLLYENDFIVKVPKENLEFVATITNYSTSITNLYEEGAEGKFKLELTEKS